MEEIQGRFTDIDSFTGTYAFLSNDTNSRVFYNNMFFPCASCALIAAQFQLSVDQIQILNETLQEKKNVRDALQELKKHYTLSERNDWKDIRLTVMEKVVRDKFRRNPILRSELCETGDRRLLWVNKDDDFFGRVGNIGLNHLGRLLMKIRQNINDGIELKAWLEITLPLQNNPSLRPLITLLEYKPPDLDDIQHRYALDPKDSFWMIGKLSCHAIRPLSPTVSRTHGLLTVNELGDVLLIDLNSTAGTFLDKKKLEKDHVPYPVKNGSVIKFGSSNRIYVVQLDVCHVKDYLILKQKELHEKIETLTSYLENPCQAENKTHVKVFVKGFSLRTTKEDLIDFFQSCGEIEEVILPLSHRNTPDSEYTLNRGFAIIKFKHPQGAFRATDKNGTFLNKRNILLMPSSRGASTSILSTDLSQILMVNYATRQDSPSRSRDKLVRKKDFAVFSKHSTSNGDTKRAERTRNSHQNYAHTVSINTSLLQNEQSGNIRKKLRTSMDSDTNSGTSKRGSRGT